MKTSAASLKKGQFVLLNGSMWQVLKTDFNYRGRGSASVKTRIRNVESGAVLEHTTKSDYVFDTPEVDVVQMQFLYKDGQFVHFMELHTFEQHQVAVGIVGDVVNYLKEGDLLYVLLYEGKPLTIRPPQSVRLKIIEADDAVKGDTATAPKKTAVVETGVSVKVPLFIKKGDTIVINPETGEYIERIAGS